MISRKLEHLHPDARPRFEAFEAKLNAAGIAFVRACTYRSPEEQARLYAQGRTAPGRIVTHAKPGQSNHNYQLDGQPASLAADYYPLINGKLADRKTDEELRHWASMRVAAMQSGLRWGGDWREPKTDYPHFEYELNPQPPEPEDISDKLQRICELLENAASHNDMSDLALTQAVKAINQLKNIKQN